MSAREWDRDAYGDPIRPDLDERPDGFDTAPRDADGRMVRGELARRLLGPSGPVARPAYGPDADQRERWEEWND